MHTFAYIDSGSGSLILQAMAGGVAGVAVVGRLYWRRVKRFFGRGEPDEVQETQASDTMTQARSSEPDSGSAVGRTDG